MTHRPVEVGAVDLGGGEGVVEHDVDVLTHRQARRQFDDLDPVVERFQHRVDTPHDHLVVVEDRHRHGHSHDQRVRLIRRERGPNHPSGCSTGPAASLGSPV
ncbi:hypothetical protein [Ornithinimicrobium kibberense]|uniref:hypothetical protein n=1 Tax=Ornithinimicrobium kibberense TaxID=282060 RepID=UPI00361D4B5E